MGEFEHNGAPVTLWGLVMLVLRSLFPRRVQFGDAVNTNEIDKLSL